MLGEERQGAMTDQRCPKCGAGDVSSSLAENVRENVVEQISDCAECGVEWRAVYVLSRIESMEPTEPLFPPGHYVARA